MHRRRACSDGSAYPCKICIGGNGGGNGEGREHLRGVHANYLVVVAAQEDRVQVLNSFSAVMYAQTRRLPSGRKAMLVITALVFVAGYTLKNTLAHRNLYDWRSVP